MVTKAAQNVGFQHLIRGRESAIKNPDQPDSQRIIAQSFSAFFGTS
jgi:hypothetical protein